MLKPQIIEQIKTNLIQALNPLEIYLFGSQVWGTPHQYSDVDIFVVVKKYVPSDHEAHKQGHLALYDIDMPSDLVIMPQTVFAKRSQLSHTLPYKIKKEGMKIYART